MSEEASEPTKIPVLTGLKNRAFLYYNSTRPFGRLSVESLFHDTFASPTIEIYVFYDTFASPTIETYVFYDTFASPTIET